MSGTVSRLSAVVFLSLLLAACGGESGTDAPRLSAAPPPVDNPPPIDEPTVKALRDMADAVGLDGDPSDGLEPVLPGEDPLVKLGQILFFSRTLSGRMDVACASCHHPDLAGGDDLTLPVGVVATQPEVLGLGRTLDAASDPSPEADGGPNVPRNSQTIFNVALYDRALFHDGRVFVLDETEVPGGQGQNIRTPESGTGIDSLAGASLLEAQARFPLVSNDEMRGYMYPGIADPNAYREYLLDRLRGKVDAAYLSQDGPANWLALFRDTFNAPLAGPDEVITMSAVQQALAAYQSSQIFVDTDWKHLLAGDDDALSEAARRGAVLFFNDQSEGGLGCVACHSGDHFTNEQFYNVGFPQIGRGKRADGSDFGRFDVNQSTRLPENAHAMRVPSLLNVGLTAPYGHAGTFATLEQVLRYHADPVGEVEVFDFTLSHLPQAEQAGADGTILYPEARSLTEAAIGADSFQLAAAKLPERSLTVDEVNDLVAFLQALTDDCAADSACIAQWTPDGVADDPDGNLLVRGEAFAAGPAYEGNSYPAQVALDFPAVTTQLTGFPDTADCQFNADAVNAGSLAFSRLESQRGLDIPHGFEPETWFGENLDSARWFFPTMHAGGLAAAHVTDDCWPDLVYAGGDTTGTVILRNRGGQLGFENSSLFADLPATRFASVSVADINGDYRREIILGNLHPGEVPIYASGDDGRYVKAGALPMDRNTYGIAFRDFDGSGYPDMYLAHWGEPGVPGGAPVFFTNDGGALSAAEAQAGVTESDIEHSYQFAPGFADFTGNGHPDLVVASDFGTSVTLYNSGSGPLENATDEAVITDEFGMGSAIGDFDNDGKLDWFVTSISAVPEGADDTHCADWSGNRLYRNVSTAANLEFEDVTVQAGVADGGWGWGACAADFNNDGHLDLFHVNGVNEFPQDVIDAAPEGSDLEGGVCKGFSGLPARLFINDGDGTFTERAADWGIDHPEDGRGVVCFDYDRDGDIDIASVNHSKSMIFLENQSGSGEGRNFLALRLTGEQPNTEALGARVRVSADLDGDGQLEPAETQVREVAANSNFASQNPADLHFGLGSAAVVSQLEVRWPDGSLESCSDVPVNRVLTPEQGAGGLQCP